MWGNAVELKSKEQVLVLENNGLEPLSITEHQTVVLECRYVKYDMV